MSVPGDPEGWRALRLQMVQSQLRARDIVNQRVLQAMERVPRHLFAPERYRNEAYEDHPLPIAEGQTISQPYIVAIMLQALAIQPTDRVLEVGTGSGYVTALLAEVAAEVISIERHATLTEAARTVLADMGYGNVRVLTRDGTHGFSEAAPYHAILVSAAAPQLPPSLVAQLAEGGRMMIPIGGEDAQQLQFIQRKNGQVHVSPRELCRFVPLIAGDPR